MHTFAQAPPQAQNEFGQAAKNFNADCPAGSLGAHASSFAPGQGAGPREGIGQIASGAGESVSALGNQLNAMRESSSTPCSP